MTQSMVPPPDPDFIQRPLARDAQMDVSPEVMRSMTGYSSEFPKGLGEELLELGKFVEVPTWQALDVKGKPQGSTWEMLDRSFNITIPDSVVELQKLCKPNLPWAENQFKERVGGEPLNPGDTYYEWPWYKGNVDQHRQHDIFSHTYMERYWPKQAGGGRTFHQTEKGVYPADGNHGIRFDYGDLSDVVNLLAKEPTTRQAYLPVFFPEDTGAVHGERVPCSLGYLFNMRENRLNITYYIRSCDFLRHFLDDVYMTARLCQWVSEQAFDPNGEHPDPVRPGRLTMHIGSLHVFEGDLPKLKREYGRPDQTTSGGYDTTLPSGSKHRLSTDPEDA